METKKFIIDNEESIQLTWFKCSFFPDTNMSSVLNIRKQEESSLHTQKLASQVSVIRQKVQNSEGTELFHKLCTGELTGNFSVSEED